MNYSELYERLHRGHSEIIYPPLPIPCDLPVDEPDWPVRMEPEPINDYGHLVNLGWYTTRSLLSRLPEWAVAVSTMVLAEMAWPTILFSQNLSEEDISETRKTIDALWGILLGDFTSTETGIDWLPVTGGRLPGAMGIIVGVPEYHALWTISEASRAVFGVRGSWRPQRRISFWDPTEATLHALDSASHIFIPEEAEPAEKRILMDDLLKDWWHQTRCTLRFNFTPETELI